MVEWHLPPDYIVNNWTDELLDLMVQKLVERKEREAHPSSSSGDDAKVSVETLSTVSSGMIKVEKRHGRN